jgi:cleavage and polyadenylation specificity factor subunit 3
MAEDVMTITPLGSGQEVGRSCHVLEFRDMNIMLDCGIHPGYEGMNGLPFLDRIEPERIDILLITHFHLDHAASLPYFTERTGFKGRIFMTHPTKAVIRLLLGDYLRLLQMRNAKSEEVLYTEAELLSCIEKIELIDYHQTVTVKGLTFYALNAGHVLGACMYWLDLGGRSLLYTGDYSMEDDRHLMAAEIPPNKPDVLMVESTYGVQVHASKKEREARFTGTVERVVTRGGRCLIPVFALGRAQELLLILDEYWKDNTHLQKIPIYYASKMASRALRVYQTYSNMMNARIRDQMDIANPFAFTFIQNLKSIDLENFDDSGPSVVFASPGMLQSGVSRQLFDRWATDPKNGVLIAGYAVEHTLAKEIMNQPKEVVTLEGRRQPLNCLVDYVSFSAHVDFVQNRSFIAQVDPKHIILVHGQKDEMGRLKSALMLQYRQLPENKRPTITMPPNLQEVKLKFARRRSAKVMGSLADRNGELQEAEEVKGIMVTHNFSSKIVAPEDLATYTPLRVGSIASKLHIPFAGSVDTLKLFLNEMFVGVTQTTVTNDNNSINEDDKEWLMVPATTVFGMSDDQIKVTVGGKTRGVATVEWDASPANDVIADAVVALVMHAQSSAASIRITSKPCRHRSRRPRDGEEEEENGDEPMNKVARSEETTTFGRLKLIGDSLRDEFKEVECVFESNRATYEITTDCGFDTAAVSEDGTLLCHVAVEFDDEFGNNAEVTVECADTKLASHVRDCIRNVAAAAAPLQV